MHHSSSRRPVLARLILALFAFSFLAGARSVSAAESRVTLTGHVPAAAIEDSTFVGALNPAARIQLAIVLPVHNQAGLNALIHDLYDPSSPFYHHFITSSEFAQRFGASQAEYNSVISYAKGLGLSVTGTHSNNLLLDVAGTTQQIEAGFGLHLYNLRASSGRVFYAPDSDPKIPVQIVGSVLGIVGLDNSVVMHPMNHQVSPLAMSNVSPFQIGNGPNGALSPSNIKTAYNMNGVTQTGAGQTIALYELDGYTASDVTAYESFFGLPSVTLQNVLVDGFSGAPSGGNASAEVTLDIELQIALAPGVTKVMVYEAANGTVGMIDEYSRIATDNLAKSISSSWGIDETSAGSTTRSAENTIFQQMATQGQSIFAASGDNGAFDNGTTLSVDDPASQPFMTGVGGTLLSVKADRTHLNESAWGNSPSGGGGGISAIWSKPSYQAGVGSSSTFRNVPDVSLAGDPNSGYAIFYNGGWGIFGGTSCAAPLWAAFAADVNQARVSFGQSTLGFANPSLYSIGNGTAYTTNFYDSNDNTTNLFYHTVTGYDDATGWGSFNGANLLASLASTPPTVATAASATPNPVTSATSAVSALGADDGGESALTYTWATTGSPPAAVAFSPNGTNAAKNSTATFTKAGSYTLQVTIKDGVGLTVTSTVAVTVNQTFTTPAVTPFTASVVTNGTQQFIVTAKDQFGNAMAVQPSFTWSVTGGGTISASGLFTAGGSPGGPFTVAAENIDGNGTHDGLASVTVTIPGSLAGTNAASSGTVDLTATGTLDWAHWGLTTNTSFDHKASGGTKISNYAGVGTPVVNQFATNITGYTWSDGAPTASATNTKTGLYTTTVGKGFSFTVPADNTPRVLRVYVGGYQIGGTLTAHLSDSSAADFSGTFTNLSTSFNQVFTLTYNAASAGKTLTVTWTETSGTGNVTLEAATLAFNTPDFSLSAAPASVSVVQGNSGNSTITVNSIAGFSGAVTLSATGAPSGVTPSFATNPTTGTSVLTLATTGSATTGTFPITVTGVSGSLTHTCTVNLTVTAPPVLTTIVVAPASVSTPTGTTKQFTATGKDQFGNAMSPQPTFSWTVNGGGTIDSTGLFTAGGGVGGPFTVTATSGAVSGTAAISVTLPPTLTGSNATTVGPIDLTATGTTDWAHWGLTTVTSFDHKATGGTQISNYAGVGTPSVNQFSTNLNGYTWTDGTPTATVTNSKTGLYTSGIGKGYSFTVPADTNGRTLKVYVGGWQTGGTLTAHLSDSSAPDYTGTFSNLSVSYNQCFTINYVAASAGKTLTVSWTQTSGTGNVTLQSAALLPSGPPAPAPPTGLVATAGDTQVSLSWTASSGATSYNVKRSTISGSGYATISNPATVSYTNTGLTNGVTYFYVVTAVNTGGESGNSAQASATPQPPAPGAPTGLNATPGNTQVSLTWTASSGATAYNVKRSTITGSGYVTVSSPTATNFTNTGLTNGTTYFYVVSALNGGGESANSSEASATPQVPIPAVPTGLTAIPGDTQIVLSWTASSGATTYNVKRSTITGSGYVTVASPSSTADTDTGLTNGTAYFYVVSAVNVAGESMNSSEATTTPAPPAVPAAPTGLSATAGDTQVSLTWTASVGATSYNVKSSTISGSGYVTIASPATVNYTNTGLTNGTTYYYVVTAVSSAGESLNSTEASATPEPAIPAAPTGLSATPGNTQVVLGWTAASGATGYNVKRSTINGSGYATVASPATPGDTDTGLTNGTTYYYVVTAFNISGESANSAQASATPQPPAPGAPSGVTGTPGNALVTVNWSAVSGATSYNVKRSTTSGTGYVTVASPAGTSATDTGLTNGTTYFYVVTAVNGGGESANSTQASATPQPPAPGTPTGLNATPGNAQVSLTWSASSGATSYNVKSSTVSGGPYSTIASPATASYTNVGLTNGVTYYYVVSAVNGGGESADSTQASATPVLPAPASPTGLAAVAGNGQVSLTWNASSGATSYNVKRSTVTGTGYVTVASPTATSFVNTGLTNGTAYFFVVSAVNGSDESANSTQASATPALAGTLAGSGATPAATIDLTAAGTLDWAHWGLTTPTSFDHKASGGSLISNFTAVLGGAINQFASNITDFTWADGTPTASATNSKTGLYTNGPGRGFTFTVPADTNPRTLKVYVGGYQTGGTLTAHLSDSSAPDYTATFTNLSTSYNQVYTLSYNALSAGKTLTVTWTLASGAGNVTLQAATLAFNSPDFSLAAAPASVSVAQGAAANSTISVNQIAGFSGSVNLSASGLPSGVSAGFATNPTTGSSVLTFTATGSAAIGTVPVTITGVSGALTHTVTVNLTVTAPPVLTTIVVAPVAPSVVTGGTKQFTATGKDQFGNAVTPQPTFTWAVTGGGSIDTNGLFTAGGTAGGPFTVTATSGSVSGNTTVTVTNPPSLTGSNAAPVGPIDLTATGSGDWAHWGLTTATSFDHKATGGSKISNYTGVGTPSVNAFSGNITGYTWSDGTPTATATNSKTGLYCSGIGKGYSFNVPADNTVRTVKVYVGGWQTGGTLTAHLSDSSAPDYTGTFSNLSVSYNQVFTLTFDAASAGKTLTVTWTQTSGTGNVTLQAATLTP